MRPFNLLSRYSEPGLETFSGSRLIVGDRKGPRRGDVGRSRGTGGVFWLYS